MRVKGYGMTIRNWGADGPIEPDLLSWQIGHIEKGLVQLRRGDTIPHEVVAEWLAGWGADGENDPGRP